MSATGNTGVVGLGSFHYDEAIPWFEKAIAAKRYEARAYPHFNLGRVYEHLREWGKAKTCYAHAYALDHKYVSALAAFRRVSAAFN
jgi:tetratricopeptide (TPR) repeat protein